jgi:hypothetical protein
VVELLRAKARIEDDPASSQVTAQERLLAATRVLSLEFQPGSFAAQLLEFAGAPNDA